MKSSKLFLQDLSGSLVYSDRSWPHIGSKSSSKPPSAGKFSYCSLSHVYILELTWAICENRRPEFWQKEGKEIKCDIGQE